MDVSLDPDTAQSELILSEDRKEVTYGDTRQNLPNNLKRFDPVLIVLGKEGFYKRVYKQEREYHTVP